MLTSSFCTNIQEVSHRSIKMESSRNPGCKGSVAYRFKHDEGSSRNPGCEGSAAYRFKHDEDNYDEDLKGEPALPAIPQPETPNEPIEFLSRSWSLSANEISRLLAGKKQTQPAFNHNLNTIQETPFTPQNHVVKPVRGRAIGKLFQHKERNEITSFKKKDKIRMENARTHTALSVAGLAAALAAASSMEKTKSSNVKLSAALTSATELLASYCIELAETAGADKASVDSVVRSAVGIQTASDLLTLTAAAATALRGEAAMKARLTKEAKRSASISPYEKAIAGSPSPAGFCSEVEEEDVPCVGDLLQLTRKGVLRWKHVSVYISKAYQVTIKVKSTHVGGAFSKNNKCILYEVIDDSSSWPFRKERENMELYFGVKTAQGLLEFKCKNKVHKQRWVHGIQNLLQRRSRLEEAENSLRMLNINKSI